MDNILLAAGIVIVDAQDVVSLVELSFAQMRTMEPRPPSYKYFVHSTKAYLSIFMCH